MCYTSSLRIRMRNCPKYLVLNTVCADLVLHVHEISIARYFMFIAIIDPIDFFNWQRQRAFSCKSLLYKTAS